MKPSNLQIEFRELGNLSVAKHSQRFFKTGVGEYGEGDQFLGIRVPVIRKFAKQYGELPTEKVLSILTSPFHEERLLALIMLVNKFNGSENKEQEVIYRSYLANTQYINGWDLVDSSAPQIVGGYLLLKNRDVLPGLAASESLWERRIAILSTIHFIKNNEYKDTIKISRALLDDKEDLIHKAVGWMLREVGNRDRNAEEEFLIENYRSMPRTMLRYAIEKFDERDRQLYLQGKK